MRMIHKYMTQGLTNTDMKELQDLLVKSNLEQMFHITQQLINIIELRTQEVEE